MAKDEKKIKSKEPKNSNKSFLKDSKSELKKVSWPKPKNLFTDTATVISIVLVVAAIVFVLDFAFLELNKNLVIKTEQKIKDSHNTVTEQVVNNENENAEQNTNTTTEETTDQNTNTATEENAEQNVEESKTNAE